MKDSRFLIWAAIGGAAMLLARRLARRRRRIDFADKVVVITGGSRGLGLAMARQLVREGARVALLARNPEELAEARRQLEREAGKRGPARAVEARVQTIDCDLTSRQATDAALERVSGRFGRIDVLINNAGIIQCGPLEHMRLKDFDEAMNVHFWGPLRAMMTVVPLMARQGGGRIVNIASVGGLVAVPHLAPYVASKFALVGLSDAMRAELRSRGIRVTTVCPGLMRTGSHVNATFKGQHQAEFAWFSIGNAMPLISLSAERAARRILDACRHGDAHITVGRAARIAALANALFPEATGEALAAASRLMPGPQHGPEPRPAEQADGARGDDLRVGWSCRSRWAPSVLTHRSDRAVTVNNELRGPALAQLLEEEG